jgi:hypothetical protein
LPKKEALLSTDLRTARLRAKCTRAKAGFVRPLTFSGNVTTHHAVIRREVALVEGGVFNTEALKHSVKRLNQLGYFKLIENQTGMTFQAWYALPSGNREALVTETISMKDNNGTTFTKDVKVNVAP